MTTAPVTGEYRVELEAYCGPLDLLLYLVRRQEVDLLDLPLARLTAQFVEFVEVLQLLDLDLIGEFVVAASSLLEIKSRMVLPQEGAVAELVEREEDPRAELVQQLLEYKRFKEATRLLEEQAAVWQQRYWRLSDDRPSKGGAAGQELFKEVELWDLVSALSRVLRKNSEASPSTVIYDDTPISVFIEQIKERVAVEQRVAFTSLFAGSPSRSRITGIFLAILELLRHQRYRAEQPVAYQEIWVLPPLESAAEDGGGLPDLVGDESETGGEMMQSDVPTPTDHAGVFVRSDERLEDSAGRESGEWDQIEAEDDPAGPASETWEAEEDHAEEPDLDSGLSAAS
ncbi:MAG: segregation and condensation protein A [Planctomycetaceae bacterium]